MPSLGEMNRVVQLSSAANDFVLLAKSLAAARDGISETQALAQTVPNLGMAYGTLRQVFANEIKIARVRVRLDNVDRLDKAAAAGNVSAMKALLEMTESWRPDLHEDEEDEDAWEDVVPNLSRNPEIQKNGKTAGFED